MLLRLLLGVSAILCMASGESLPTFGHITGKALHCKTGCIGCRLVIITAVSDQLGPKSGYGEIIWLGRQFSASRTESHMTTCTATSGWLVAEEAALTVSGCQTWKRC